MQEKLKDLELVTLVALDDVSAFEEIYNRYSKRMFFFAMNIFGKKEVCEDIVQNVFIDYWSKRKERNIEQLEPYLFQSVKYQIFKHLRKRRISEDDLTRLSIADVSVNILQKLEHDELLGLIETQVDELPPRCRQIFMLSRFQYKSHKEIAVELGISIQGVKNQISKALAYLRKNLLSEEGIIYLFFISTFQN